jgi:hypothetical protein
MTADFTSDIRDTSAHFSTSVNNDVYGVGGTSYPIPEEVITSVDDYGSLITIGMDFYISGGDASIGFYIFNEGTYAPVAIALSDLTASTQVVDMTREWVGDEETDVTLLDGHHYVLSMMVSERMFYPTRYSDDDDIDAGFRFENARVVSASEPAISLLLSAGLVGMGLYRRMRGGDLVS